MNTFKSLRETINATQKEVAERFSIPIRTWISWENGTRKPPVYVVRLISQVLMLEAENKQLTTILNILTEDTDNE